MNEILIGALGSILIALFLYWVYKCIVLIKEDQLKIVESYNGRYKRTLSGITGKTAALHDDTLNNIEKGDLINGEDSGNIAWIWYPLEKIPTYEMRKIVRKKSSDLTPEEKNQQNHLVVWGNPGTDSEISIFRSSISNHYRRQFTYEMHFDNIETGRADKSKDAAQNVKLRIRLNVTVCLKNAKQAMYQEGDGGKWLTTLHSIVLSCLNELCATKTFADISDLRGVKLDEQELSDKKKFKQRINEQMLGVKHLGQETIDLDFLDYEIMDESKPFAKSLQDRAIAAVNKETAKDNATAIAEGLRPHIDAKKELMEASKLATIELNKSINQTVVEQTKALPGQLRVFAGNLYSPQQTQFDTSLPSTQEIIKESLAHDIADEIKADKKRR